MSPKNKNNRSIFILLILLAYVARSGVAEASESYTFAVHSQDITHKIVASKVAQNLGIQLVTVEYPNFASKLAAVESGEVDFTANITYTLERAERLIFSAPTNIENIYFYSNRELDYQDIKTVGVNHGTVFGNVVLEQNSNLNIVEYHSVAEARQLIEDGKVDGVLGAQGLLKFMSRARMKAQRINSYVNIKPVSIVTAKQENRELLKRIESYLHSAEIQRFLRQTSEAYEFEVKKDALRQEVLVSGLDSSKALKVKIERFNILGDYSTNGNVGGIAADVVFESCKLMELDCQLVSQADESWQSMYTSLVSDQIDVLAPFALTKERKQVAHISNKFYEPEAIVIKRKGYKDNVYRSISELVAERVGVIEGRVFNLVLRRHLPHKPLITYEQPEEQLAALLSNEVDYIVMTRTTYNRLLRSTNTILPIAEDDMIGSFYSYGVGIGFQDNEQGKLLAELFNQAIELLELEVIVKKYDFAPDWQATLAGQKMFTKKSQQLLVAIILTLTIITYFWHKQSVTDNLTKLNNRLALYKKYKHGLSKDQVLIYFDVNKFKLINDNYGHRTGDLVLKKIAENINKYWLYDSYRIGGDEFVLIGKLAESEIEQCLKKIGYFEFRYDVDNPFEVKISYGRYVSNRDNLSLDDCLHLADTEMYKYKVI